MVSATGLPTLLRDAPRALACWVMVLSVLQAATEGIGVALLVPILAALGSGAGGQAGALLARLGIGLEPAPLLALFVAVVLARSLLQLVRDLAALRFEGAVADRLRQRAWHGLLHAEWRHLATLRQADAASVLISDIDRVGFGLNQFLALIGAATTLVALAVATLAISPRMAGACLAAGIVSWLAYRRARRTMVRLGEQASAANTGIFATITEGLQALRIIKLAGREDWSERAFVHGFAALHRGRAELMRATGLARLALQGGGAALLALLVWLAITRWQIGPAVILPLAAVFVRALPLLGAGQAYWQNWLHAAPALTAAMGMIGALEGAAEPPRGLGGPGPRLRREIALDHVTLRQPDRSRPILDAISLRIAAGTTVALTGPSGAGKSTLADVLAGLLAADGGTVAIDGVPLAGAQRQAWRERVGYVQQEPLLFHASIRENLVWAAPAADEAQLVAALEAASAQFVFALPQGLDTVVGWRGGNLSGGERQRIALARGLLNRPDLLILDEVTSALDAASEAAVVRAVAKLRGQMTILIISHRGALADLAERAIRLDNGAVVTSCDTAAP